MTWPTVIAVCCREWEVALGVKMRRCGYCGEVPIVPQPFKSVEEKEEESW